MFDDLRFAANATSQTAQPELFEQVGQFAVDVRLLSQAAIDAEFDVEQARNTETFVALEAALVNAIDELDAPIEQRCSDR